MIMHFKNILVKMTSIICILIFMMSISTVNVFAIDNSALGNDNITDNEIAYLKNVLPYLMHTISDSAQNNCGYTIGSKINSYYCVDGSIKQTEFSTYPIFSNEKICAIAYVFNGATDNISCQLSLGYANSLNDYIEMGQSKEIAIIHDSEGISLFSNSVVKKRLLEITIPGSSNSISNLSTAELADIIEVSELEKGNISFTKQYQHTRTVYTDTLMVPGTTQGNYPICWAACAASIGEFLTGISLTALGFANYCGQSEGSYAGKFTYEVLPYFNARYDLDYVRSTSALTFSKVETDIYNDCPIYVTGRRPATGTAVGRHAIVVNGYYYNPSTEFYALIFMDPIDGTPYNSITMPSSGRFTFTRTDGLIYTQEDYATGVHS